jgi:hypothetical protein
MSQDPSIDDEILVTDHTPQKEKTSRPSSRNSSHKVPYYIPKETRLTPQDNDDFVDATSSTVTPSSESADPIDPRKSMDTLKEVNGATSKREKSPLRYQQRLSTDTTSEPLTEISLDESSTLNTRPSSDDATPAGTIPIPPELPPRKRGSVSSASSGVSTPPVSAPLPSLPPRRGPFGWLRSASSTAKSPPAPALPPRASVASVNFAPASLPNIDLLIARLEEQSKLIKEGDDKVKEEYAVGNEELRRSFERIQKEHQPTEGEEDEIDWGTPSSYCSNVRIMESISPVSTNISRNVAP